MNAGNAISAGINAKRGRIPATPFLNIVIMKSKRLRIRTGAASPLYSSFLALSLSGHQPHAYAAASLHILAVIPLITSA